MRQQVRTPQDVKKLGTILSVWAHPDDETFSCAGLMAAAVENGQRVVCITATKGEAGSQDEERWPSATIGEVRAKELQQALDCLGIREHHWLGYRDGECHRVPLEEGTARVKEFIERLQPDTVLTFGPDGMTGHTDHIAVSQWATAAAHAAPRRPAVYQAVETTEKYEKYFREADEKFNIYFNIDKPRLYDEAACDIYFVLVARLCQKKRSALSAMPSQTEGMMKHFDKTFDNAFCSEAFVRG